MIQLYKFKRIRKKWFFLLIPICFVLIGLIWFSSLTQVPKPGITTNSYSLTPEEQKFWSDRIDQAGPEATYSEFKEKYKDISINTQHRYGHTFADLLYKKL